MRRRRARLLAILTGAAVVSLAALFATLRGRPAPPPAPVAATDGAAVYARLGCAACHALGGAGNPGLPLDGVGRRLDREEIRTWILDPQRLKPGVRKPSYDRVPEADLEALLDYLQES